MLNDITRPGARLSANFWLGVYPMYPIEGMREFQERTPDLEMMFTHVPNVLVSLTTRATCFPKAYLSSVFPIVNRVCFGHHLTFT